MAKLFKCNEDGVTEWCIAEDKDAAYKFMKELWGSDTMNEYEEEFEGSLDEFIEEFFIEEDADKDFTIICENGEVTKKVSEWINQEEKIPCWLCCEE